MAMQPVETGNEDERPIETVMITLPPPLSGKYKGCIGGFYFDRGVSVARMVTPSDKVALAQLMRAWPAAEVTMDIPPTTPVTPRQVNRSSRYMTAPRMVQERQDDVLAQIMRRDKAKRREVSSVQPTDVVDSATLIEEPKAENPLGPVPEPEGSPSTPAIPMPAGPKGPPSK